MASYTIGDCCFTETKNADGSISVDTEVIINGYALEVFCFEYNSRAAVTRLVCMYRGLAHGAYDWELFNDLVEAMPGITRV